MAMGSTTMARIATLIGNLQRLWPPYLSGEAGEGLPSTAQPPVCSLALLLPPGLPLGQGIPPAHWDITIVEDVLSHWLDLINIEGWIPREQILGDETSSKVPRMLWTDYAAARPASSIRNSGQI